jgi:hypothetical protein
MVDNCQVILLRKTRNAALAKFLQTARFPFDLDLRMLFAEPASVASKGARPRSCFQVIPRKVFVFL